MASPLLAVLSFAPCVAAEPQPRPDKPSAATPAQKPDRPALEDALLNDLDNELLEGVGDLTGRSKAKLSGDNPLDGNKTNEPSDTGEDIGGPAHDADPLVHISQEMRSVESLISGQTKGGHPEPIQRQILSDLAKLIEQAEKQCAAQQPSSGKGNKSQQVTKRQSVKQSKPSAAGGKPSSKPAQDSTDRLRQTEAARVDTEALKGLLKESWGNLPARAREEMLQNPPEHFLPQYELMIEKYYKRLAEQQNSK
ncbi:MAG: hypothetical protein HY288_02560 [Planctomycetia bacterium]|nr:hypothetical protein [Planctomycetia bacterium]